MDHGSNHRVLLISLIAGMILIYPITIIAGARSFLLLISSLCIGLDVWSPRDAARNFFLGLPVLAALAALWVTLAIPAARLARTWRSFVPATTGLLMVLILEGMARLSGSSDEPVGHMPVEFPVAWVSGGPFLVAAVNLVRLIRERNRIGTATPLTDPPAPISMISRPHLPPAAGQRPVALIPYRRPEPRAAEQLAPSGIGR
jgi:hypothetical protein